jgi:hypothetical protein
MPCKYSNYILCYDSQSMGISSMSLYIRRVQTVARGTHAAVSKPFVRLENNHSVRLLQMGCMLSRVQRSVTTSNGFLIGFIATYITTTLNTVALSYRLDGPGSIPGSSFFLLFVFCCFCVCCCFPVFCILYSIYCILYSVRCTCTVL